jgi:hypothetical protein
MKRYFRLFCWLAMTIIVLSCEECEHFGEREYFWPTNEPEATEEESTPEIPTQTAEPAVQGDIIYSVGNPLAVKNGGTSPSFSFTEPYQVTQIYTYHWNDAQGATPGTISLQGSNGITYGPWQAYGQPGQGGVPNAYWVVKPDIRLDPGSYTVVDSDPSTWATNDKAGGTGMVEIFGYTTK